MRKQLLIILTCSFLISCNQKSEPIIVTPDDFHTSVDEVTSIMVHDIFSPPVASRIYAYPNIAAYEIIAQQNTAYTSLKGQIDELKEIPKAEDSKKVNYQLAALIAHIDLSKKLIFSEDKLESYRDSMYEIWEGKNKPEFIDSKEYGLKVAGYIATWMDSDNYKQTRTMPKYTVTAR